MVTSMQLKYFNFFPLCLSLSLLLLSLGNYKKMIQRVSGLSWGFCMVEYVMYLLLSFVDSIFQYLCKVVVHFCWNICLIGWWIYEIFLVSGEALYSLRTSLNSSPEQLKDWNINQVNPCTWSNVNCDPNNKVTSV